MSFNKIDLASIITKPLAIWIVARELNVDWLMLLLAYVIFSFSLTVTFKK